ncbi:MAG: AAA family ATPase [Candidatus Marinimicrobia bacterium]|nr:AAA family ATPase [Candidatus Neomarinimicrobiota bacterium]
MFKKKRRIQHMDPKKVDTYNKFLCTLDQKTIVSTTESTVPLINSDNNICDDIKTELDNLICQIQESYDTNNHGLPSFSGQNPTDTSSVNNADPNYYRDIVNQPYFLFYNHMLRPPLLPPLINPITNSITNSIKPKIETPTTPVDIRETINIETEIHTISDILHLIERYQLDPAIKYNINLTSLHAIKEPLKEINCMIGMKDIKSNLVDQILYFVQDLHKNKHNTGDFLHTVIYGPPGTGKTEIAKLMGKIYSHIGMLNKGTFKKVTRSDLIAGYLGQTAIKTRDVIKESLGGVLFIDEAYALGNPEKKDSFAKECLDTLCEALSDNKDNLMVIIAGYEKELKESFFNCNPGLESRFTWRFKTDEYTGEDLYNIFLKKVSDIEWRLDENSNITSEWFKKNRDYFPFFGRDMEALLAKTKIAHSRRIFGKPDTEKKKLNLADLDNGFKTYMYNEDVKNRKSEAEFRKQLYNTLYS